MKRDTANRKIDMYIYRSKEIDIEKEKVRES